MDGLTGSLRTFGRFAGLLGRTSRTTMVNFLILCLFGAAALWFGQLVLWREQPRLLALLQPWRPLLGLLLTLAFLWLSVRRINDQDRPGSVALAAAALGLVVVPTGFGIAVRAPIVPLPVEVALALILGYIVLLCLPGTVGPNRYGPDPRGWKSREHYLEQRRALARPGSSRRGSAPS